MSSRKHKLSRKQKNIIIKNTEQIKTIKESGKFLTELLHIIYQNLKPWIALIELEEIAQNFMDKHWIKWAFKWYNGFPANLCLSVNDCVVHWIPDWYILKNWDLLKVDCGVDYKWWISDAAFSKIIGWKENNLLWHQLIKTTKLALDRGVELAKHNVKMLDFSKTVYHTMIGNHFSVIETLTWHWVWVKVHEEPFIYNVPCVEMNWLIFKENMVLAFEPITAISSTDYTNKKYWVKDNWRNLYTENWDLWAQREYTVLITKNWCEVLAWIQNIDL